MSDVLLDTNVLICALNSDSVYCEKAKSLLLNKEFNFFLTNKNISEFISVASKLQLMPYKDIIQTLRVFCSTVKLIYPDKRSNSIFNDLITKYQPAGIKVFDIEIISIMIANGLSIIATYNENDFNMIPGIEIIQ